MHEHVRSVEYNMLLPVAYVSSKADSSAIIHRRDAVRLLEGTIEIGRMLETAMLGDVLNRKSGFGLQQVSCLLHLYLQHVRGGGVACNGNEFPVQLSWAHVEFLCQRVHIQVPFVQEMVDEIHRLGKEASLSIRELLLLVRISNIAELVTQTVMTVKQFFYSCSQLVGVERLGNIGIGPCL